jgi:hypothetical protein
MVTPTIATLEPHSASRLTVHSSLSVVTQSLAMIVVRTHHPHLLILPYPFLSLVGQGSTVGRPAGLYGLVFTDVAYRQA